MWEKGVTQQRGGEKDCSSQERERERERNKRVLREKERNVFIYVISTFLTLLKATVLEI